ncbi:MAG TPA: hypothetical protein VFY14_03960 [Streptomyces sp.]|nr:hypothetical protein [Streptomyces sp.]
MTAVILASLFAALALLGVLGLAACAPGEPGRYLLPAARTVALVSAAAAYAALLFH